MLIAFKRFPYVLIEYILSHFKYKFKDKMQKAQHKTCCANAWRRRWTAYALCERGLFAAPSLATCAERCLRHRFPHATLSRPTRFRAIARISLLVPPRHSLLQNQGKITPFRPFYLEKCQKNDRKLIEKGRKLCAKIVPPISTRLKCTRKYAIMSSPINKNL